MSVASDALDPGEGGADMTPMIDMVFQLIIFFVVVNDFSSTQTEPVVLADASRANTDAKPTKDRTIIVNVLPDGQIKIKRNVYGGPKIPYEVLKDFVGLEAEYAGTEENNESPGKKVSKLRVIIRADQDAKYEHVQKVMKACAENGVFKTVISAFKEDLKLADR